ncbi:alginate O-acetyltransferase AlgX-related protein [Mesorhizobium sp. 98Argb]
MANIATIGAFAAFLAAPVGSLVLMGLDPTAERAITLTELTSAKLLTPNDEGYRNDVARRLVSNSPVGMDAIRAKNALDFKVFGFVNTSQVISGADGWLFYKPGFQNGACMSGHDIGVMLAHVEALRTIAKGIGIDFRMSVSPDKEVVYPEKLGPAAEAAAGCKILSSRMWRRIAKTSKSSIIDHFDVMGHDTTDDLLYYRTDTHWNELGKLKAVGQLVFTLTGRKVDGQILSSSQVMHATDMPNRLMRIDYKEAEGVYDDYVSRTFPDDSDQRIADAFILHDSFYGVSYDLLKHVFLNPHFVSYGNENIEPEVRNALAKSPKYVLVNSVERNMLSRILYGELSWTGVLGQALLDANAKVARGCKMSDAAKDGLKFENLSKQSSGDFTAGVDPQILIRLAEHGRPCVRISFETPARQNTYVYLPIRDQVNQNGPYFEGFSLMLTDAPGARDFWFVFPVDFAGMTLRVDPIYSTGTLSDLRIQTGALPSFSPASNM